jgi:hypothetical protein
MVSKIIGGWLFTLSLGTAGVFSYGEYLRRKNIGIEYLENKPNLKKFPKTEFDWIEHYKEYQRSPKSRKEPISYENFKKQFRERWDKNLSPQNMILHTMFPFSNPRLKEFDSVKYINFSESKANEYFFLYFLGPFLLLFRGSRNLEKTLAVPVISVALLLGLYGKTSGYAAKVQTDLVQFYPDKALHPWFLTEFQTSSWLLYGTSLYYSLVSLNPFGFKNASAEVVAAAKKLVPAYALILQGFIALSIVRTQLGLPKEKCYMTKECVMGDILDNVDVDVSKGRFLSDRQMWWVKWGVEVMMYAGLIFMANKMKPAKTTLTIFRNSELGMMLLLASAFSDFMGPDKNNKRFSDFFVNLLFFTSVVYGTAGVSVLARIR